MTPTLTLDGRRATILFDDPPRRNALGRADLQDLARIIAEIDSDDRIDLAVLQATGSTFCSGYDLGELRAEMSGAASSAAQVLFAEVADALENIRVPTLCVLDGGAYGGGSDIALACDIRVGTGRTKVAVPAARFGLQFYYGGLRRSVERLGLDAAKRIFLLAETLDAAELRRIGFLGELVDAGNLSGRVDEIATLLLANVPSSLRGLKRSLNAIARGAGNAGAIDAAFAASFAEAPRGTAAHRLD
jgi:enoyl-CoA hydratase/carnithine racemase